ncbi:lysosomal amino acid transporter 1 homolog [Spea bombifrons]|uniref:lysosomal amino acid transporter 1 homolog n=1 Tax=Spea bombifrons TaxID=233779 RepID=UPI00234BA16A|nr:lysosomal amino acid transporter 1 homolog [Spea bombifrons]
MGWRLGAWSADPVYSPPNMSDCPNGSRWIWNLLNECAVDGWDVASVYLGLLSIPLFITSSLPQYYRSIKTGNMDKAISIWFLLGWLAGDSCNFIGAFLSHQLPLQTYTAVYYVMSDILMLTLYIYYKYRKRSPAGAVRINAVCGFVLVGSVASMSLLRAPGSAASDSGAGGHGRRLLAFSDSGNKPFTNQEIIGVFIGSVSSLFYLMSRIPQMITNFKRRSTEGLSVLLFLMVVLGNLTYGTSVLLKNPESGQSVQDYILRHLPWIIGSLGVMSLDIIILLQFLVFRKNPNSSEEREPLLSRS